MLPATLSLSSVVFFAFIWAIRKHFVDQSPNLKMRILAILGLIAFAAYVEKILFAPHSYLPLYLIGAALHILALHIFSVAILATRARNLYIAFSEAPSDFIITNGPYAYIRHPFYTAYAIFWLGCTIETLSLVCATLSFVLFGFYVVAARQEEAQFLASPVAASYRDYQAKVGPFWPRLRGRPSQ